VRIETDNDTPDATLQLWVQPAGSTDATQRELQRLPGTRDERAWADAAGPLDGGVLVSNRLRDWVRPVDLSALRGDVEVVAVLTVPGKAEAEARFPLRIDDTPPRFVEFGDVEPRRLVKGNPVGVSATAEDRESDIVRAYFFVGRPLDDGTPPPDAPKFEAALTPAKGPFQWTATAQIPVPADKKGDMIVGVVFVNDAGIATVRTQRIEIVDGALVAIRTGTVVGRVTLGERPQPGLIVTLTDADGKVKGTATTDDAGRFRFEKVIPGNYTLASAKKDSSYGSAGSTPVDVKADPEPDPKAKPKPDDRPQANVSLGLTRRPR
jgi:hypothetical protein